MAPHPVTEVMEAYADDAVEAARADFQIDLDYSVPSLHLLDDILEILHRVVESQSGAEAAKMNEMLETFTIMWGAYLGEVIRRKWGGEWIIPDEGPFKGMASLVVGRITMSPLARAYKRILSGPEEDVCKYVEVLRGKLSGAADRPAPEI